MNCGSTLTSKIYSFGKGKIVHLPIQNWLVKAIWQWLDGIEVRNPKLARLLCQFIPAYCPFERTIKVFGHKLLYIPPLCQLNPFYNQLMALRFRALSFLADTCGEDIAKYYG